MEQMIILNSVLEQKVPALQMIQTHGDDLEK